MLVGPGIGSPPIRGTVTTDRHPLKGSLGTRSVDGKDLEQWQFEVTSAGRGSREEPTIASWSESVMTSSTASGRRARFRSRSRLSDCRSFPHPTSEDRHRGGRSTGRELRTYMVIDVPPPQVTAGADSWA